MTLNSGTVHLNVGESSRILLDGMKGLSMYEDALYIARNLLSTEDVFSHPDFLLIELPKDKNQIGIDGANKIVERCSQEPIYSDMHVIVINGIDLFSKDAQNKLLKALEEAKKACIIAVSYNSDDVLPTVKSRLRRVVYQPLEKICFCNALGDAYSDIDKTVLYYATDGCIGLVSEISDLELLRNVFLHCQSDREKLLADMHLVKEKDVDAVTNSVTLMCQCLKVMRAAFIMMAWGFMNEGQQNNCRPCLERAEKCNSSAQLCSFNSFTSNDFLRTVMFCIRSF